MAKENEGIRARLVDVELKGIVSLDYKKINPDDIVINGTRYIRAPGGKRFNNEGFARYSFYVEWNPAKSIVPMAQFEVWLKEKYPEEEFYHIERRKVIEVGEGIIKNLLTNVIEPIKSIQKWVLEK